MAHQTNYVHEGNKFNAHKQYLLGLLFSGYLKKTHTDRSALYVFLICLKRNNSETFKSIATAKNLFSSVYVIGTTFFDKCFLFLVITGRRCFL